MSYKSRILSQKSWYGTIHHNIVVQLAVGGNDVKRFIKTTFQWDTMKLETDLRDQESSDVAGKNICYLLDELSIVSVPHSAGTRRGTVCLKIKMQNGDGPQKDGVENLRRRLISLSDSQKRSISFTRGFPDMSDNPAFRVTFDLKKGEQFTDAAIEVASFIFHKLGIKDREALKHHLGLFITRQETLLLVAGDWIPFEQHVRHQYGLHNPEHTSQIELQLA